MSHLYPARKVGLFLRLLNNHKNGRSAVVPLRSATHGSAPLVRTLAEEAFLCSGLDELKHGSLTLHCMAAALSLSSVRATNIATIASAVTNRTTVCSRPFRISRFLNPVHNAARTVATIESMSIPEILKISDSDPIARVAPLIATENGRNMGREFVPTKTPRTRSAKPPFGP